MPVPKFFPNAQAFRKWLEANASSAAELLVGYYKVATGKPSMSWSESVDEALCFGWIDGVRRRIDDESYQIRFTPRRPTSTWSAVNIAKFETLQAEGRMTPAGAAAFRHRREAKSVVYSYEQESPAELAPDELREFKRNKQAGASSRTVHPATSRSYSTGSAGRRSRRRVTGGSPSCWRLVPRGSGCGESPSLQAFCRPRVSMNFTTSSTPTRALGLVTTKG